MKVGISDKWYVPQRVLRSTFRLAYLSITGALLIVGVWKQSTPDVLGALTLMSARMVWY